MGKLIIDGNSVYEIDEECIRKKERQRNGKTEEEKKREEEKKAR